MYSGAMAATTGWQADRRGDGDQPGAGSQRAHAARCAAPVFPRDPATMSTRP